MKAPFSLLRLDHLVLRTADVDRLVEFYLALGATVVRKVDQIHLTQLAAGNSLIDIVEVADPPEESGRNLDHFAIRIDPFDEAEIIAFCRARNIEYRIIGQPIFGADGYGPAIYIRDPEGNRVELKGPPLESSSEPG